MTVKTAPKSTAKPAETTPAKSAETTPAKPNVTDLIKGFDWNAVVDEASATEYTRGPDAWDGEKETPERIRLDVAKSFAGFKAEGNAGKGAPLWMTQKLASPQMANAYMEIARKYGAFKGWTVRGGVDTNEPTTVRFCAKPKESRKRKPAAAATPDASTTVDGASAKPSA